MNAPSPDLRRLSPGLWVTGQVWPGQAGDLRRAGITCLVNHRPDGEEPGQPSASEIARAGAEAGLKVVDIPIRGLPDESAVAATRAVLDALGPDEAAVFFCRRPARGGGRGGLRPEPASAVGCGQRTMFTRAA